jgi:hypothetical protein
LYIIHRLHRYYLDKDIFTRSAIYHHTWHLLSYISIYLARYMELYLHSPAFYYIRIYLDTHYSLHDYYYTGYLLILLIMILHSVIPLLSIAAYYDHSWISLFYAYLLGDYQYNLYPYSLGFYFTTFTHEYLYNTLIFYIT